MIPKGVQKEDHLHGTPSCFLRWKAEVQRVVFLIKFHALAGTGSERQSGYGNED